MRRGRASLIGSIVALALLAPVLISAAQSDSRTARIGVLTASNTPRLHAAFVTYLRDLGYIEGRNLTLEWRFHHDQPERLIVDAADLVRRHVDVIVASSVQAVYAARGATLTIPTIMIGLSDPVGSGLIASLARPGGNVTGCATPLPAGLIVRQVQLFKEIMPEASRVALLMNPANGSHVDAVWRDVPGAAHALDGEIVRVEALGADIPSAVQAAVQREVQALIVLSDPLFRSQAVRIADLAARWRMPSIYPWRDGVAAGGLMSYGLSERALWRCAAEYAARVLKGADPGELSVEELTTFELIVNPVAASRLDLTIPSSLLLRADEVIQ